MASPVTALGIALVLAAGGPARAQECSARVVVDADPATAALRIAGGPGCRLDEAAYGQLVTDWLLARPRGAPLRMVALGRIDALPWLADALTSAAAADPHWRAGGAAKPPVDHNRQAAAWLSQPAVLARLSAPFAGTGHAVAAVIAEKVRVGPVAPGGSPLPYDAQVWLRIAPTP